VESGLFSGGGVVFPKGGRKGWRKYIETPEKDFERIWKLVGWVVGAVAVAGEKLKISMS